jgi:hypothetical protein
MLNILFGCPATPCGRPVGLHPRDGFASLAAFVRLSGIIVASDLPRSCVTGAGAGRVYREGIVAVLICQRVSVVRAVV